MHDHAYAADETPSVLFGELYQNNSLATVALAFSDHSLVVGVKGLTWLIGRQRFFSGIHMHSAVEG